MIDGGTMLMVCDSPSNVSHSVHRLVNLLDKESHESLPCIRAMQAAFALRSSRLGYASKVDDAQMKCELWLVSVSAY